MSLVATEKDYNLSNHLPNQARAASFEHSTKTYPKTRIAFSSLAGVSGGRRALLKRASISSSRINGLSARRKSKRTQVFQVENYTGVK